MDTLEYADYVYAKFQVPTTLENMTVLAPKLLKKAISVVLHGHMDS